MKFFTKAKGFSILLLLVVSANASAFVPDEIIFKRGNGHGGRLAASACPDVAGRCVDKEAY